ncbi:MAG: hypothetical protein K5928_04810 [Prevotella sp.]|nr:hypothetical protein [Prevotella sp.]
MRITTDAGGTGGTMLTPAQRRARPRQAARLQPGVALLVVALHFTVALK